MQDVHKQELAVGDIVLMAHRITSLVGPGISYVPLNGGMLKIDPAGQTIINPDSCVLTYPNCTDPIIGNKGD